ncbi:MAG: domain S-box [Bryobacterales bacterium]|nr:domain S-box [Bryobacterales bacterium]
MRDLVALSALSSLWTHYDAVRIAASLADVLREMLEPEFVYIRLWNPGDTVPAEISRDGRGENVLDRTAQIGRGFSPTLAFGTVASSVDNPVGKGQVRITAIPIGRNAELGVIVAASQRDLFPSEPERLLLTVAANQTGVVIGHERAAQQRDAERGRWRELLHQAPAAVAVLRGPEHVFELVNPEYERAIGRVANQVLGRSIRSVLPELADQALVNLLDDVYRSGKASFGVEHLVKLNRDNSDTLQHRFFNFAYQPARNAQGDIEGVFVHAVDVTEQVVARRRLERTNDELRRANGDLEAFAHSASHDLQEPLRNVAIYAQLLHDRHGRRLEREAVQFLDGILTGAVRMNAMIKNLFAYSQASRVLAGSPPMIQAGAVLESVLESVKVSIQDAGAIITSDDLPPVAIHEVHLSVLFSNLISNALKYRRSTVVPRIHLSVMNQDREWVFSVSDNGIGIDPVYSTQIFELFKRLHTASEYTGTGLGLSICKRIVEQYGGRIWVESALGHGCRFNFSLPSSSTLQPSDE